ncbi:hypothetical protein HBA92_21360 [Ochrobactrum sp. MR28]|nr:hypothetical protein [Ochrobactrum sp. MR28]MBX8818843.1 hypothetical protein [Ochrobactrum sp. MR31]
MTIQADISLNGRMPARIFTAYSSNNIFVSMEHQADIFCHEYVRADLVSTNASPVRQPNVVFLTIATCTLHRYSYFHPGECPACASSAPAEDAWKHIFSVLQPFIGRPFSPVIAEEVADSIIQSTAHPVHGRVWLGESDGER